MRTITATFRIVTPMFLGDAEQMASGIRPPSIKGALRFWWRALNWKRATKEGRDEDKALQWLHAQEARLFGSAAKEKHSNKDEKTTDQQLKNERGGQGIFLLKVTNQPRFSSITDWPKDPPPINGSTYLAFGITKSGSVAKGNLHPHREGIPEGKSFDVQLLFKPDTKDEDIHSIHETIMTFGLLGDLGSRNRRGLGSIALKKIDDMDIHHSMDTYTERLRSLFEITNDGHDESHYPPYSSLSSLSAYRIFDNKMYDDARSAHNSIGSYYYGHRGKDSGLYGEEKIPFGIPLQGVSHDKERRSSPLFFHIHPIGSKFVPIAYYMPARFHPRYQYDNQGIHSFYRVLREFMEEDG